MSDQPSVTLGTPLSASARRVLLLGAGGAVRGILEPFLAEQPQSLVIANRTVEKAELLAELFDDLGPVSASGFDWLREPVDVIINATSAGHSGAMTPMPGMRLSVGMPPTFARNLLIPHLPEFYQQWPDIEIQVAVAAPMQAAVTDRRLPSTSAMNRSSNKSHAGSPNRPSSPRIWARRRRPR